MVKHSGEMLQWCNNKYLHIIMIKWCNKYGEMVQIIYKFIWWNGETQ